MAARHPPEDRPWMHGHSHDPNPLPPEGDGDFVVYTPGGEEVFFTPEALARLPLTEVGGCLIVSTGHGASGPFTFGGVHLADLLAHVFGQAAGLAAWRQVDVISTDGFGTRLFPTHLAGEEAILLAYRRDGRPLTRAEGLVRLVVPSERDDALRQVKWVSKIVIA